MLENCYYEDLELNTENIEMIQPTEQVEFLTSEKASMELTENLPIEEVYTKTKEISFEGKYTETEISRMRDDVSKAEYEVSCRKNDVSNWESKVSLNDTKAKHENGDYNHAVRRLNEAKQQLNNAVSRLNSAQSKLNNAL